MIPPEVGRVLAPILLVGLIGALSPAALLACDGDTNLERLDGAVIAPDAVADVAPTPPAPSCVADADCDDARECTVGHCALDAAIPHCVWEVAADWCLINNVCRAPGDGRAGDTCAFCDPGADALAWTSLPDGEACDDRDVCTAESACAAGRCVGEPTLDCDDGEACTRDRCDPVLGCVHEPLTGDPCDDGLFCTTGDACVEGRCEGGAATCDDGDPCTDDLCTEDGGCAHEHNAAPCDDGDPCTSGDLCRAGACVGARPNTCDDDNPCTEDACIPEVGCVHLPTQSPCCVGAVSACDDSNPCTVDLCDPQTGDCAYEPATGACDDGDACTVEDTCDGTSCVGAARDCDDDNPCTVDSCNAQAGCVHQPISGPACDDGLACSVADACVAGVCQGDTSACLCEPDLGDDGAKLVTLALGDGGHPGEGLDLDDDPETCAPAGSCSGGVDNTLGIVASFANDPLADAVGSGDLALLLVFDHGAGDAVAISVFEGVRAPSTSGCAVQTQVCDWLVGRELLDPDTCEPRVLMPGTITGNLLEAAGTSELPFSIRLSATASIEVTIRSLRVRGTVTRDADGDVSGVQGILGGAVPKQQLLDGVAALPDGALPGGLDKPTLTALIDALVHNDLDTNGDGVKDAASIGLKFTAIDARVVGAQ